MIRGPHINGDVVLDSAPTNHRWLRSYEDWRRNIPWTNEEIALALQESGATEPNDYMRRKRENAAAYLLRTQRLSSGILGLALPFLVRVCAVCGKKALYRYGSEGRCSAHRDVQPGFFKEKRTRLEEGAAEAGRNATRIDLLRKRHEAYHVGSALGRNGKRGRKG